VVTPPGFLPGFRPAVLLEKRASEALWSHHLRVHQYGVEVRGLTGRRSLRYAEVETFTFRATRDFPAGLFHGVSYTLTLAPAPGRRRPTLRYRARRWGTDGELEVFRDQLAARLATRLEAAWRAGQPVHWAPGLRLLRKGVEWRPYLRQPPLLLPYAAITRCAFEAGAFQVAIRGRPAPLRLAGTGEPNFYPGYLLLLELLEGTA
jgi:hypothetical protein